MRAWFNRPGNSWIGREDLAIYVLLALNIAMFALCLSRSGDGAIRGAVLAEHGAIFTGVLGRGEVWRLLSYGFLHANPLHLAGNMLCLVVFGPALIRRVKIFYFLLIYLASVIVGGYVSIHAHHVPFLTVGASGGMSGLLGALACLWLLGRAAVPLDFLLTNIGLSVVVSAAATNVDWQCHLGGFTGGFIACAVLDRIEVANRWLLSCKFPEFLKVNGAALLLVPPVVAMAAGFRLSDIAQWGGAASTQGFVYLATCLALIKLTDFVLPLKKGLALVIAALGNALAIWALGTAFAPILANSNTCRPTRNAISGLSHPAYCQHLEWSVLAVAVTGFLLTLLIYSWDLRRGLSDVGFIGNTLKAERRRSQGL